MLSLNIMDEAISPFILLSFEVRLASKLIPKQERLPYTALLSLEAVNLCFPIMGSKCMIEAKRKLSA